MTFIAVVLLGAGIVLIVAGIENQPITATVLAFFSGNYVPTIPASNKPAILDTSGTTSGIGSTGTISPTRSAATPPPSVIKL